MREFKNIKVPELDLSGLRNIKFPEIKFPIFKTEAQIRYEKSQEKLREQYKFYCKCLRVLSRKRGKEKLINEIKVYMINIEANYSGKGIFITKE